MRKVKLIGIGLVFFLSTFATFSAGVYFGRKQYSTPAVFPDGLFVENYQELTLADVAIYELVIEPTPEPVAQKPDDILGAETEESAVPLSNDLLAAVNSLRNKHGLGELDRDSLLCEKVDQRLSEQLSTGKIDNHAGFGKVKDELFAAGFMAVGENLAQGFATPDQVVNVGWQNSASHLSLLLSSEYGLACGKLDSVIAVFIAGRR